MTETTDPHGWPVATDQHDSPATTENDIRVLMGSKYPGPCISVCIAEGQEAEATHLTSSAAREYADRLNQAADILDAVTSGEYVPPVSTFVPRERTPFEKAMAEKVLRSIRRDISRASFMEGSGR